MSKSLTKQNTTDYKLYKFKAYYILKRNILLSNATGIETQFWCSTPCPRRGVTNIRGKALHLRNSGRLGSSRDVLAP
jgi:hypothetical protein